MNVPALQRALARRVRALERDLPAVLDDDVEALHRARVASRRLREILPVLGLYQSPGGQRQFRKLRRRLRKLTSALGGVRELDVALGILVALDSERPEFGVVLARARRAVETDRRACRDKMARQLGELEAGGLFDALARLIDRSAQSSPSVRAELLRRRLSRRADGLERAVAHIGPLFAVDRLHEVRIAAKKLRYVLESVHQVGAVPTRRLVTRLKRVQDLLGRLHDLDVVSGYVRRQRRAPAPSLPDARMLALERIEREMRELHAQYLDQVHQIDDLLNTCRSRIDRLLAGGPPGATERRQSWPKRKPSTSSGTRSRGSGARSTRTTRAAR